MVKNFDQLEGLNVTSEKRKASIWRPLHAMGEGV